MMTFSNNYMNLALKEAASAAQRGEVPVGAVIVNCATGVVNSATGVVNCATGVVNSATGVVNSATGVVNCATGVVLACVSNRVMEDRDPSAHAEVLAIRAACKALKSERLTDCDLYVTLEPCPMCAQLISFARIRRLYFAADDQKGGGVENGARVLHAKSCHHRPEIYGGIGAAAASKLLKDFFQSRR